MKKRMLSLATVAVAALGAFADTVNTTMDQFYFESKDAAGVRLKSSYEWDVSVAPGGTFTKASGTTTFRALLGQPFTTVEDWGLSDTKNIAAAAWQSVASTNFTYTHTTGNGTKYLYMFVRYFRYNLTLNAGAGTPSSYVTNNICYTNSIALPTPSRTGYDFMGWTNRTLTAALNGSKTGSDFGVADDGTNVTLYAKWTPKTFQVTFDKNGDGDAVSPATTTVTYDALYGELPSPTWTGHTFSGWFTEASGGSQVTSNTTVSITSAQNLYAHWTTNTYTVTFNANGGSTPTSSKTVTYGETYGALPTPTWEHHNFSGWFTDSSGGTKVEASDTVGQADDIMLYAQWTSDNYSVIFYDTDYQTVLLSTNVTYGTKLTPPAVTLAPNQFLKWWNDGAVNYSPIQPIEVKGNMTLYPEYQTSQATLTLVCSPESGGSAVLVEGSLSGDAGRSVMVAADPSEAYLFSEWSDGVSALTNTVTLSTNTTLTAYFSKKTLTVSFVDWDGVTSLSEQTVEYGDAAVAPDDPTNRVGYTFASWNADFSHVISNMTVVAQYAANRYTVVYDANGGGGTMTNDVFTYDQEYQLQSNNCTRVLHDFLGWASDPDAATNEVEYIDGATVSNLTAVANGTNMLYAVWQSQLSDLSVAADCDNLILKSDDKTKQWVVDDTEGYNGQGSSVKSGQAFTSLMKARIEGPGTLSFGVKTIILDGGWFGLYPGDNDYEPPFVIQHVNTDGAWKRYVYEVKGSDDSTYTWLFYSYGTGGEKDQCWLDQIHWYPNRFVTVESNKLTDDEKNAIKESILQNWDAILGANATSVSTVTATGPAVTNAVTLLEGGTLPGVEVSGASATLTFNEAVLDVLISEFSVTNLPSATLKAILSPHGTPPDVGVWGATTLTSDWSRVITTDDFSAFAAEGIVSFEFDVSTNRFFKVIAK